MVQVDSIANYVSENLSSTNEMAESIIPISDKITPLLWLLIANIVIIIAKFVTDSRLKKKDVNVHRKGLINEFIINIEKELFYRLETLSRFDADQTDELLVEILNIETYCRINRIFLRKNVSNVAIKILDYYKAVSSNYAKKDIKKENELMAKYSDKFYE